MMMNVVCWQTVQVVPLPYLSFDQFSMNSFILGISIKKKKKQKPKFSNDAVAASNYSVRYFDGEIANYLSNANGFLNAMLQRM